MATDTASSVIGAAEAKNFLAPRPVSILPGVGPAFAAALIRAGFSTVGGLARAEPKELAQRFGTYGLRLSDLANGRDDRPVDPDQERKGVSAETTFNTDLDARSDLEDRLWPLCEKVGRRMREGGLAGRAVVLKLKTADFRLLTRRRTLAVPTQTARTLFSTARELLAPETDGRRRYRLIGVGLAELVEADSAAADLFDGGEARTRKTEHALDALRGKFGPAAVVSGRALRRPD